MTLGDFLKPENVIADLDVPDRWQAIDRLVANLVETGRVAPSNRDAIFKAIEKRELSLSTGIGLGVGIPHASTDLINEVVGVFARSLQGIDFQSLDNQPVNVVTLFLVPHGQFQQHLPTLASIAKVLKNNDFRESVEKAKSSREIYDAIIKAS
jgi:mannitol/fructose-specific phosphotransferase system IIA component (Ntr-type)